MQQAKKAYWGMEVYSHTFFTLTLDGGEWSASCPGRSTLKERAPGPRAGLDTVAKKKFQPIPRIEPRSSSL